MFNVIVLTVLLVRWDWTFLDPMLLLSSIYEYAFPLPYSHADNLQVTGRKYYLFF